MWTMGRIVRLAARELRLKSGAPAEGLPDLKSPRKPSSSGEAKRQGRGGGEQKQSAGKASGFPQGLPVPR